MDRTILVPMVGILSICIVYACDQYDGIVVIDNNNFTVLDGIDVTSIVYYDPDDVCD